MELFEEKNTTETSAPAKRYEGKAFIFSDIPSQEKSFKFCVQPLAWTRRE